MIVKKDLYSYSFKKEELKKALGDCSNETIKEKYEQALKATDQSFEVYGKFYKSMKSVITTLQTFYEKYENDHKKALTIFSDSQKSLSEIDQNSAEGKRDDIALIMDKFFNHRKYLSESICCVEKLIDISLNNRKTVQKIADDQAKLLKVILESTADVLFLYIFRVDMADINRKVMKEFVSFVAGIIPLLGPFASGLNAIVNSANIRAMNIKSADNVLNYLDNYIEAVSIWTETTQGYIRMLNEWMDSF